MKLIVGIGNPQEELKNTKHNLGFIVIDYLIQKFNLEKLVKKKFDGLYIKTENFILLKPQISVNNSGICVKQFVDYYNISQENLLIIFDDFTLPFGKVRFRKKYSNSSHNGIKNIIINLNNFNYLQRLKIGIGYNNNEFFWKEFVMNNFTFLEKQQILKVIDIIFKELLLWIENKITFEKLMQKCNYLY